MTIETSINGAATLSHYEFLWIHSIYDYI